MKSGESIYLNPASSKYKQHGVLVVSTPLDFKGKGVIHHHGSI